MHAKFKTKQKSWLKWFFEHLPKEEKLRVLELGCGTGLFWVVNRNKIPSGWLITLTDYSEGMIATARSNLSGIKRMFKFDIVNAEEMDYPVKNFDVIVANNMLYHVRKRPATINKISQMLSKNGVFFASTMGNKHMHELNHIFYEFLTGRNKTFKFRENIFSLENGFDQLKPFFSKVEIFRYSDVLKIDEIDPIIKYYQSFNDMYKNIAVLPDDDIDAFREFLQKKLDVQKIISASVDTGIFICSN